MKDYSEMSDHEINKAVAKASGLNIQERSVFNVGRIPVVVKSFCGVEELISIPDYCNNPSDMWPLIVENGICITSPIKPREKWTASWFVEGGNWSINDATFSEKNPLRAAAIVFLMLNKG